MRGHVGDTLVLQPDFPRVQQSFQKLVTSAYPEGFPGGGNQAGTGAVAEDTLGFYNGDSTYSVSFTFAHLDPNAVITFQSWVTGNDEKFGLDNVHVTTPMPEPGSMLLFGSGMALVGLFGRRKGRSS